MGLQNFTPKLWAAAMLVRLRKTLVHASLVNRDYEGEIRSYGDTVKINEIGTVTVNDYTKGGSLTWQTLTSAQKELLIDQAKSFSFSIDDIDMAQNKPKVLMGAMSEAAYAVGDVIDQHLAGLYTQAGNSVSNATVSAGTVLKNLSDFQLKLNEANVPTEGRFIIVPPWYIQHLVNAATGAVSATAVPKVFDDGMLVNGFVGSMFGLNILMSNNINNNGTVWNIMAFTRQAITHAGQIAKIAAVERESYFDQGVKGLYLYGSKVVRPEAMVKCAATKG